jgi:uncharacterized protein (TIGR03067 family)
MQALIAAAVFGIGVAFAVLAAPPTPDNPPVADEKKAIEALKGGYIIVSGERDGKAIREAEIKGAVVRFDDGKVTGTDKERQQFFTATYTLDVTRRPWKIDMKTDMVTKVSPTGETVKEPMTATGLIKKEGDTLTIIYALPGGEAPTEFKTKTKQQMFVLMTFMPEKLPNKFQSGVPVKP